MVRLGIPSKGRLMGQTFEWFSGRGINLVRSESDREYAGHIEGIKNVQLIFLSASEIPRELSSGRLHFGVTGTDVIQEKLVGFNRLVEPVSELGFGFADLIIAVPSFWVDVETLMIWMLFRHSSEINMVIAYALQLNTTDCSGSF